VRRLALLLSLALAAAPLLVRAQEALESRVERGPVSAELRVEPAAPLIGDPVVLILRVTAEPDVELLMPEFGEALDRFLILDFAPREELDTEGRTVAIQRYTLEPSRSGPQSIPPIAIEFVDRRPGRDPSPEGEDAYELLTERLDLEVASLLPEDAELALRPAQERLGPRQLPGPPIWPFALAGLIVLGAAAPFALRAWLAYRVRATRKTAYQIASAALEQLLYQPRPGPEEIDAFFVELSGIVRRYLEGRFGLRSPELTTEEFLVVMTDSPDLLPSHRGLLQELLTQADLVKFALHMPASEDVEESIGAARRFLDETREELAVV
jgi:hypothetical protein